MQKIQQQTIRQMINAQLPTRFGLFQIIGFERDCAGGKGVETAFAILLGDLTTNNFAKEAPLLRIHSQCVTSEMLGSLRCDCKEQLEIAMGAIAGEGSGLVIYEHQEGRGI